MDKKHLTIMINSTFYDMLGEYTYFLNEVYPELEEICRSHGIELEYRDVAYSVLQKSLNNQIILEDLRHIDADRTFFICFRGHKLGWKPDPDNINRETLSEYPELVDYIGRVSITDLVIMHALKPFDRMVDGEIYKANPVKHCMFYFRNSGYGDSLNETQRLFYINTSEGRDKQVKDMEIAKAKDLIHETKREFDKIVDLNSNINIRYYDGIWSNDVDVKRLLADYTDDYSSMTGENLEDFIRVHEKYIPDDDLGGFCDFNSEGKSLKEIMIEDFIRELKLEFPENF